MKKENKKSKQFIKVSRDKSEIYKEINEKIIAAEESRTVQLENANEGFNRYNNIKAQKNTPWKNASNVSIPITTISLDTKLPRWSQALIERDPICRVIGSTSETQEKAKKQEAFIKWADKNWFNSQLFWLRTFKAAGLYPLSVVKLYWEKKKVWKYYEDDNDLDKSKKEVKKDKKYIEKHEEVVNQAKAKVIPFENILLPPNCTDIEDASWIGEYIDLTIREFKELSVARNWDKTLTDQIVKHAEKKDGEGNDEIDDNKNTRLNAMGYESDTDKKKGNSVIRIIEFWGDLNVDDKGDSENVNVVIYRPLHKCLEIEENPYWHKQKPYVDFKIELTDEIFGKSVPEKLKHMQDQSDALFNMFYDNMKLSSQKMFRKNPQVKPSDIKFKPGGYINAKRKEDVEVFDVGMANMQPLQTMDLILDFSKRLSGDSDYNQGQQGTSKRTATEVMAVLKEGNQRYRMQTMLLASSMQRFYKMFMSLCRQYVPQTGLEIKLFGEDGSVVFEDKITPDDLKNDFELEVVPNYEIFSLEATLDLKIRTMELVQRSGVKADIQPLLKEILEMLGVKQIDNILIDNPVNEKIQMKNAMMENAVAGEVEIQVSEIDNDEIHMKAHSQALEQIGQLIQQQQSQQQQIPQQMIPGQPQQNAAIQEIAQKGEVLNKHLQEHMQKMQSPQGNR